VPPIVVPKLSEALEESVELSATEIIALIPTGKAAARYHEDI
jgi:hypothetical protein